MLRGFTIIPGLILDLSIDSKKIKEETEEEIRKDFGKRQINTQELKLYLEV